MTTKTQTAPPGGGSCLQPQLMYLANNQISGYGYDSAGNMTSQTGATYTYDNDNRLVATNSSGGSATYLYDASGRRVQKTVGSNSPTFYVYNKDGQIYGWLTPGGRQLGYAYVNGQVLAQYQNGTTYFHHHDHLGSTRLVSEMNQVIEQCNGYYPFGEVDNNQCTPTANNDFTDALFTGKEHDSESNLDNFTARYFSSQMGRFMSPNPTGGRPAFPQSWNAYSYVLNNPLSAVDPNGLDCVYLNDAGNGIESVDNNSNAGECRQNGGAWTPGTITNIGYDPNSNEVLLGYANAGDNGNVDYSQITATPGQFSPGNELDAVAAGVNASNPQGFIDAFGTLIPIGGAAAYGGMAFAAGTHGWGTLTTGAATAAGLGGTAGPVVTDPELQAWINELFQATDQIPGGTAGAVRYEARTGILLSPAGHFQEAEEILGHLNDLIRSGELSVHDQVVAKGLAQDLSQALGVAKSWGAIK